MNRHDTRYTIHDSRYKKINVVLVLMFIFYLAFCILHPASVVAEYLGEFKAGTSVFYGANFHNDTGTIEDPTSPEAQQRTPAGAWSGLTAPAKQNSKTGFYGGTIDTTGYAVGEYIIRMAGTVTTAKTTATIFSFTIVANIASDTYSEVTNGTYGLSHLAKPGDEMILSSAYDDAKTASQFDPATDEVDIGKVKGTGVTSVDDFKADVSGLATQTSVNDIDTSTESAARFTEIKGSGWTDETLKAIKDAVDASGGATPAEIWAYATRKLTSRNIATGEDIAREQTLTGNLSSGVLQNMITVIDSSPQTIVRGNVKPFTFILGAAWPLTDKKVYFTAKTDKTASNSTAIINRACTITDPVNGVVTITPTAAETANVGSYYAEIKVYDNDDTNPQTARLFMLKIIQDVRQ
jgi:hypothetical protein